MDLNKFQSGISLDELAQLVYKLEYRVMQLETKNDFLASVVLAQEGKITTLEMDLWRRTDDGK